MADMTSQEVVVEDSTVEPEQVDTFLVGVRQPEEVG